MTHQQRLRASYFNFSIITEILSVSLCQSGRLQLKKVEDIINVAHLGRGGDRPLQTRPIATPGALSFKSVQFSHSVVSDCLGTHGLQHARIPSPSPIPGVRLFFFFLHRTFSDPAVRRPFYKMPREELKGSDAWAKLNVSSLRSVATITPS